MDTPDVFTPGQKVSLAAGARVHTFTIDRPFLPFTKSVVLLARCEELAPHPVVVKIFDPRYLDERFSVVESQPSRPWTLAAERAAAALPAEAFNEDDLWEDEPDPADADGLAKRAALWEEHYRRLSTECFASEHSAYERLPDLQGTAIPRLLLTGEVVPPDERAIRPPAVVLEYIPDAVSLNDVSPDALDVEMCATLVRAIDSFSAHGVFHGDINVHNILFTPKEKPVRAVCIDFGCAGIRAEGEDEETWQFNVGFASDERRIRLLLKEKGVVLPEAVAPAA
ncbi:hypothetical protein C8Q80DRAFT_905220 [Daedaleopsis nitida]|nr:hypothetical protein C8Q80DRAFT_905220 [Daedaleopsis nitida]